jgi:hypothetical protein
MSEMQEDNVIVVPEVGPDLSVPPHILPALIKLFTGEQQQVFPQQEQLLAHFVACSYCQAAFSVLLSCRLEYDRSNNDPEEPARDLLSRFAALNRSIEANEARVYERLGMYAEAVVSKGRDKAAVCFPEVAAHLKVCSNCCSALEATVISITESDEIY